VSKYSDISMNSVRLRTWKAVAFLNLQQFFKLRLRCSCHFPWCPLALFSRICIVHFMAATGSDHEIWRQVRRFHGSTTLSILVTTERKAIRKRNCNLYAGCAHFVSFIRVSKCSTFITTCKCFHNNLVEIYKLCTVQPS
jgi:hypothetical protein